MYITELHPLHALKTRKADLCAPHTGRANIRNSHLHTHSPPTYAKQSAAGRWSTLETRVQTRPHQQQHHFVSLLFWLSWTCVGCLACESTVRARRKLGAVS